MSDKVVTCIPDALNMAVIVAIGDDTIYGSHVHCSSTACPSSSNKNCDGCLLNREIPHATEPKDMLLYYDPKYATDKDNLSLNLYASLVEGGATIVEGPSLDEVEDMLLEQRYNI